MFGSTKPSYPRISLEKQSDDGSSTDDDISSQSQNLLKTLYRPRKKSFLTRIIIAVAACALLLSHVATFFLALRLRPGLLPSENLDRKCMEHTSAYCKCILVHLRKNLQTSKYMED